MTGLSLQRIRLLFFFLAEHGLVRVLDALTTLVLIRVFTASQYGLFTVFQSWASAAFLFLPSLELSLYRHYARWKETGELQRELRSFRTFNFLKITLAGVMVLLFSLAAPKELGWWERVALMAFAMALPLSQAFFGTDREILRFELKQNVVTWIGALQRLTLIAGLIAVHLAAPHGVILVSSVALGIYFLFGWLWSRASRPYMGGISVSLAEQKARWIGAFAGVVVWMHLNGVIAQVIQTMDVIMLNFYRISVEEIGRYGIALKAANFFQIVHLALAQALGVYLGRRQAGDRESRRRTRNLVLGVTAGFFALSAVFQLIGMGLAEPLLLFLAKGKLSGANLAVTTGYFNWLLAGVLFQSAFYPVSTYLGIRAPLRATFFCVLLPWLGASVLIYFLSARSGPLAVAQANLAVYGVLNLLFLVFWGAWGFRGAHAEGAVRG